MSRDTSEFGKFLGLSAAAWGFAVFLVAATALFFAYLQPVFMAKETQTTRQSNAYITSQQTALRTLYMDYISSEARIREMKKNGRDTANGESLIEMITVQQRALVRQMREQADLIPGSVQSDIKEFLAAQR